MRCVTAYILALYLGLIGGCSSTADSSGPRATTPPPSERSSRSTFTTNDHPTYFMGQPISHMFDDVVIVERPGYVAGFSSETRTPIWVCYRLKELPAPHKLSRPKVRFKTFQHGAVTVRHKDYTHSGFDRGHLAPSSAIGQCFGPEAQLATYTTANICPQHPGLNRRCWQKFEQRVIDDYVERFDVVYVVTGPIYSGACVELTSDIRVPDAFFKVIVAEIDGHVEMLGVVMPNKSTDATPIRHFVRSVDEIEILANLELFDRLDARIQAQAEAEDARTVHADWRINDLLRPTFPGDDGPFRTRLCD